MDPTALIGGGASILSAILAAQAEHEKVQNDWLVNWYNTRHRDQERQDAIRYADELRGEQKLGGTNAAGDRTYYKEGVGWVTDLGSRNQDLLNYFYGNELPARRSQFERGDSRSRADDDMATQMLQELQGVERDNPTDVENMLYEASTRGIGDQVNDATETALRSAFRRGATNTGDIAGKIAKAGAGQRSSAAKDAKLQALDFVDDRYNSRRNQLSQLYNLFAGRAGRDIGSSYDPSSDESGANALLGQFAGLASQGNATGANAVSKQGGTLGTVDADNSLANMFGGAGAGITGIGDRLSADRSRNDMSELLKSYISGGGRIDLGQGGLFDTIAQRSRIGGGTF